MNKIKNEIFDNIDLSANSEQTKKFLKRQTNYFIDNDLPVLFDQVQIKQLFNIDNSFTIDKYINKYEIKKRNGNTRTIYQPYVKLKKIQSWILKNILNKITISSSAHAYVKGKSIISNAKTHFYPNKRFWLLSMDISNFFDTITFDSIKKTFEKIGYSESVSWYLASLCSVNNNLVQGFPTSAAISNIIFESLDKIFNEYSKTKDICYSRYADDLFFSSTNKITSEELKELKGFITKKISEVGFLINDKKTNFYSYDDVKKVTGLVIRENGIFIPQKIKRKIYKEIYYCEKFGIDSHLSYSNALDKSNFKGYMYGYAYFIKMVEPEIGLDMLNKLNDIFNY